jgi:hypothetical protein
VNKGMTKKQMDDGTLRRNRKDEVYELFWRMEKLAVGIRIRRMNERCMETTVSWRETE